MKIDTANHLMREYLIEYTKNLKYNSYFNLQFCQLIGDININEDDMFDDDINIFISRGSYFNRSIKVEIGKNYLEYINLNNYKLICKQILKHIIDKITDKDENLKNIAYNLLNINNILNNKNICVSFSYYEDYVKYKNNVLYMECNIDFFLDLINLNDIKEWMFINKENGIYNSINNCNFKYFKVKEKENYTINDFKFFMLLNDILNVSFNNRNSMTKVLNEYLKYILKHYKIHISSLKEIRELNHKFIIKILRSLNENQIVRLINNEYLTDLEYLKYLNKDILKKVLCKINIPFKDRIELTNYGGGGIMNLIELKNETIKYLEKISYNNCFCLQFYFLVKNYDWHYCEENTNKYQLYVYKFKIFICNDFLNDNKYTKKEKIDIVLENLLIGLVNEVNIYNLNKININNSIFYKHATNNYISIIGFFDEIYTKQPYNFEKFSFRKQILSNIYTNIFEYINVNNILELPDNIFDLFNDTLLNTITINNFKVIEKDIYNQNDYVLLAHLLYYLNNDKWNNKVYKDIVNKYFNYILKNCRINESNFVLMTMMGINEIYLIKLINTLDKEDIINLIDNNYIKNICWLKDIDKEIKKDLLSKDNISFEDKIKLTSFL